MQRSAPKISTAVCTHGPYSSADGPNTGASPWNLTVTLANSLTARIRS